MPNRRTKHQRVDPDALNRQTAEVNEMHRREGPRLAWLASYLNERKEQNGFGEDFAVTFNPRGA